MIKVQKTGATDYGNYASVLVAGPPGKGKTRFSVTAKDPYLLNAEAGSMSIADQQINTTPIEDSETLLAVRNLLSLGPDVYEEQLGFSVGTVIIDTFDEISRIMIRERLEREQKESMQAGDWTWLGDQLNAIVRGFRSLDMHVIFTCHIKDQQEGESGKVFYKLDLSGAIAHQLPGAVDLCFLLDDRMVPDEEDTLKRQTLIFTEPNSQFDWIKDRSGKLPSQIPLNFKDDFQTMMETVFGNVEIEESEVREVDFESTSETPINTTQDAPVLKTPEASEAAIEEAEQLVEEAKSKLTTDTDRTVETKSIDLSDLQDGDRVEYDGNGYELNSQNKIKPITNTRFVYHTADGQQVLSKNQLQKGVVPVPNPDIDSGVFCQVTGVEVSPEDANISRIRYRQVLCESEFTKVLNKQKSK